MFRTDTYDTSIGELVSCANFVRAIWYVLFDRSHKNDGI